MKLSKIRLATISATLVLAAAPAFADHHKESGAKFADTNQKSRAEVQAEAEAWVASGMSQMVSGDSTVDPSSPIYKQALRNFNERMSVVRAPRAK